MKQGFTLIELLVVVLIIGILAAVAVPQYQFAVDKSRIAPYIISLRTAIKAEQLYFLTHGNYTNKFTHLDLDLTNVCANVSGTCFNELTSCQGGFSFHIPSNSCSSFNKSVDLRYCQDAKSSCSSSNSSTHLELSIFMDTGKIKTCDSQTTRGARLCTWLKQQF